MGTLIRTESMTVPKSRIISNLKELVKEELSSRYFESDMYQGDFGNSSVKSLPSFEDKTRSSKKKEKNLMQFSNGELCNFDKYVIDYAIIGLEGYIAYEKPKVSLKPQTRLNKYEYYVMRYEDEDLLFESHNNIVGRFDNIVSMKQFVDKHHDAPSLIGATIDIYNKRTGLQRQVGSIESNNRHYKNKPKSLPKKYVKLDEIVNVAFGGGCPY